MTSFEHAMLGVTGCLAAGLQRRHGWKIVALAAVAAVIPDWDGLTLVGSVSLFDRAHRAWGHSVFSAAAVGLFLGVADYRFDLLGRVSKRIPGLSRQPVGAVRSREQRNWLGYAIWCFTAAAAALSHLAADLAFSGGAGLADWELKLWWPLSERGYVYPLVRWGDVGVTLIFVFGMFALVRWPKHTQRIAGATLGCVALYVIL